MSEREFIFMGCGMFVGWVLAYFHRSAEIQRFIDKMDDRGQDELSRSGRR